MADAPDAESPETRSHGRRFAVLATLAGVVLLVGGFFIGRVSESESSEPTAEETPEEPREVPKINTRACGKTAGPDAARVVKVFPPHIVTDGAIEEQPKGSAGRALLEWWQAYQFNDIAAVEALTSPATIDAIGEDRLRALVVPPDPGLQGISVMDASESGSTATVNAGLLQFQPEEEGEPPPRQPTSSVPETFTMEKQGDDWLFAATEFLSLKANALPPEVIEAVN
jgi:hypothetical protein